MTDPASWGDGYRAGYEQAQKDLKARIVLYERVVDAAYPFKNGATELFTAADGEPGLRIRDTTALHDAIVALEADHEL